jgi:ribosomal protein S18 acetylase RimI-like enzyme
MDKLNIRFAETRDFSWLQEHEKYISENMLKTKIEYNEIYIVEYNGKNIGWLRYNLFWDEIPFMNMIFFLDEYRKMGFGTKLVQYWETEMKQYGYKNVLTSTQANEEAQHFYRKMGYKEIGGFVYFDYPYEIIFQKIF